MNQTWTILATLLLLNGLVALLIGVRSWLRRTRPGQAAFACLMMAAGVFSLFYGFEIAAPTIHEKTFWLILENQGIVFLGPFWFLFAIGYTQRKWITPLRLLLLFAIPVLTLCWFASGLWPTLYYTSLTPLYQDGGPLVVGRGIWYWVQMAYAYLLLASGTVILIRGALPLPETYRGQVAVILLGIAAPWISNAYYLLAPILFPSHRVLFDPTPLAFTAVGLVYSVGVFGFRLFDLIPVARTAIFENIPELVVVVDTSDRIVDINSTGRKWMGLKNEEVIGRDAKIIFSPWPELLHKYIDIQNVHEEIHVPGSSPEEIELTILPLKDAQGRYAGRLIMGRDITVRRQIDDQLRLQSAALNAAANAIVITDTSGTCIWVNPAFTQITGYGFDEILGKKLSVLKSGVQDDDFYKSLWLTILAGETWSGEIINRHKMGHLYSEEMTIAPVRDGAGRIINFIAVKQDITERKRIENNLQEAHQSLKSRVEEIEALQVQLREQAIRDPLTGLFNRRFLEETIEREVARAQRDHSDLCVAMIDVDHFKEFNDQYGHKAGDVILQALGIMLSDTTRTGDAACRYGGEEFIVIMPGASREASYKRANEWRIAFQYMNAGLPDYARTATISIGLAYFPDHGRDCEALVDAADKALYQAKDAGRNRVAIFGQD